MLIDADLAALYDVDTRRLNEQVKRNRERFPKDFIFELTSDEFANLKSQFATSSLTGTGSSAGHGGRRKLPLAFTEHGATTRSAQAPHRLCYAAGEKAKRFQSLMSTPVKTQSPGFSPLGTMRPAT